MPNIYHDIKLDFKDVLLRPKRSQIRSRADVSKILNDYTRAT
jgi:GMP reductase